MLLATVPRFPVSQRWHVNCRQAGQLSVRLSCALRPSFLPASASVANPVDMIASATGDHFGKALVALLEGYGHRVHMVAGDDPATVRQLLAGTLDEVVEEIAAIQRAARAGALKALEDKLNALSYDERQRHAYRRRRRPRRAGAPGSGRRGSRRPPPGPKPPPVRRRQRYERGPCPPTGG